MTTAHRPTFDPAQGKEALRGPAYHQRLLPAYTHLKVRQPGQGGDADNEVRDLRAELLKAEAAHFAKKNGTLIDETAATEQAPKRQLEFTPADAENEGGEVEDPEAKRRRILEETRDIDADSDGSEEDSSEEEDSDDDDDEAALMRELEQIKKERAAQKEKEVCGTDEMMEDSLANAYFVQEQERAAEEEEQREVDIARGNPLLNTQDFNMKRRWDDDVVFKNQARGTENKDGKEFVNDLLRSDFHKRFMGKYVR
ncbi:uncharacterized protein N7483_002269 [Penicillium malachiteum]|uniref:uncharacterized protein n=1 Tax=Penicillium malachiteum TaxID=1324776 RepID=UPI002547D299|nr:uncharacterized protein N7483_002269 [Penicillium malachiteum]KAJ5737144.1 hypothetical protein N7483_002269 [Penicillium malachiteum]